jgi:polyisoprenoid-binding protein YceI
MKKLVYGTIMQLAVAFIFSTVLSAQEYKVNTSKTVVKWEGSKVVAGSHEGTISVKSGSLSLEEGLIVSGNIVVDMTTINDTDLDGAMKKRLEDHLKSDDFFGVEKFPLASLEVEESESIDDNNIKVYGMLTIKDRTNPVSFESSVVNEDNKILYKGTIEVDRSLYDVRFGSGKFFDNLGDKAINDIFTLEFELLLEK